DLGVAVEAGGGVLLDVAVATVDLHGPLARAHREPARDELRLRGDEREGLAAVPEERGAVGEEPRRLDLRGEVRELHLDRLEPRDRLAERAPLPRVGERLVERPLGEPEAEGGDADPAAVEDGQELAQAGPPGAEQVRLWHPAAVEAER